MSQNRDYSYPSKSSDDGKEDIRHIEEVPHSEKDSAAPMNNYSDPNAVHYTGRWGRLRYVDYT